MDNLDEIRSLIRSRTTIKRDFSGNRRGGPWKYVNSILYEITGDARTLNPNSGSSGTGGLCTFIEEYGDLVEGDFSPPQVSEELVFFALWPPFHTFIVRWSESLFADFDYKCDFVMASWDPVKWIFKYNRWSGPGSYLDLTSWKPLSPDQLAQRKAEMSRKVWTEHLTLVEVIYPQDDD